MFGRISAIALNSYRESVRARVLIGMAGIAFAMAFYSLVIGAFALQEAPRVVSDLGAMTLSVFSVAVAIMIGATTLHRELEMKTIFPLLARPLRRAEYLVGKYLGTMLVIAVFVMADAGLVLMMNAVLGGRSATLVIGVGLALVLALVAVSFRSARWRTFGPIPWSALMLVAGTLLAAGAPAERRVVLGSAALALCEVAVVAAMATFFASFSTPFVSALLTVGTFIVGRSADSLARLPVKFFGQGVHDAGVVLSRLVPNMQLYTAPRPLLTGEALDVSLASYLGMGALQAAAWSVGLMALSAFLFQRRDFL
ncbi:MAG: ABC transporter permease subunit [Deltaproteobacteria bacterium]|nr:ABC transporter permease subunit [Deltaproteobacteria bacterium]